MFSLRKICFIFMICRLIIRIEYNMGVILLQVLEKIERIMRKDRNLQE